MLNDDTMMIYPNRFIATFLVAAVLVQANCVGVYYGLFLLNQKAIAETVCEKKTADCCGHCYLNKQIAAAADTQPASSERPSPTRTLQNLFNLSPSVLPENALSLDAFSTEQRYRSHPAFSLRDGNMPPVEHPPNA
jgi:hypothetical protein